MPERGPRPSRIFELIARALLVGEEGRQILDDLEESFLRDLERPMPLGEARRRYSKNVLGSIWSLWTGRAPRSLTRGALLDFKVGLRMLAKQPMLTGVAMLALGLGIPSSLAVQHGIGVILSPLPVPEGERLLGIRNYSLEESEPLESSVHDYARWRDAKLSSFESIGAARSYSVSVFVGEPGAAPVRGAEVSASVFPLLRAAPLQGRMLLPSDEVRGSTEVVVIGEDLWKSRFAGDPQIVGKVVKIGKTEHTVVGVMPSGFRFPMDDDVWLPLRASPLDFGEGAGPGLWVFGRLRDEVTEERAALDVAELTKRLAAENEEKYGRWVGEVVPMPLLLLGEEERIPELVLVQAILLALLLLVCGNVGTLILARTSTRLGELSIRSALGASRTRIVTQLFVEALVLSLVATGLGLLAAELAARWFMRTAAAGSLPYWMDLRLGADTVLVALGLAVLAAVTAGVLPALRATRRGVAANLQQSAGGKGSVRFGWGSSLLIVSEVVLSVGFLASGGALVRGTFQRPEGDLGLEPERYLKVEMNIPRTYETPTDAADSEAFQARVAETQLEVLRRIAAEADVRGVGMGSSDLADYSPFTREVILEGSESEGATVEVASAEVDAGFLSGLGRPILAGRDFTASDVAVGPDAPVPVIANSAFVEQRLGGRNAIGQRFKLAYPAQAADGRAWFEVVGVVGNFGMNPINPAESAGFYEPMAAGSSNPARYVIEVAGDPTTFVPRLREIVGQVDPEATVDEAMALNESWKLNAGFLRWVFMLEVAVAGVAFVLAVSGLYALMSFTVSQRTREVAIRSALGAQPASIVSTIARRTVIQLTIGLAIGGVWAWVLLGQVADDPMTLPINKPVTVFVTLLLTAIVGAIGCASPTIRGLRIQPSDALRD